ncbi:bifunctional folylpolyglutamate synthase/dihydrofolate synthase [Myxacorys almedinensis]|uniref:tetrahydrofolate synthase n=1 Tax=Myxacorys almedinensis A TaxID=2690445 RepID=A0A8J7Z8G8_9CYAN|nr:folylpolyglutamate synthase/dihydrofolate synthase family protein [Myxacorys almedinensis]NDJ18328.1 bifunctional folylpolyglutamate synthase/dihydrofolate synthase [Myxacorys almedinensis A]
MLKVEQFLQQFELFGVNLGLEASLTLLAALDHPEHHVPIIHVAGSNGKGSVCAYLSSVLAEAGYKVGRYTSPHLIHWCERICINGQPISPDDLYRVLLKVQAAIDPKQPSPTQFEVITAAMWLYFAEQAVDMAIVEVGLGGRLDATNVVDRPIASIITSISREHWQRLGDTIAQIAAEKAGILKPNCPAVVALSTLPSDAQTVIGQRIKALSCLLITPRSSQPLATGQVEYDGIQYYPPLPAAVQRQNVGLAIATLFHLKATGWNISDHNIINGIEKTKWAGRLQWCDWKKHKILIDGAHNVESAKALRDYIDTLNKPSIHWVMGMLSTKDHSDIFKALLQPGDSLYLVPVPGHSSAEPKQLVTLATQTCPGLVDCQNYQDVFAGLDATRCEENNDKKLVVLCGSLYLIGDFLAKTQTPQGSE